MGCNYGFHRDGVRLCECTREDCVQVSKYIGHKAKPFVCFCQLAKINCAFRAESRRWRQGTRSLQQLVLLLLDRSVLSCSHRNASTRLRYSLKKLIETILIQAFECREGSYVDWVLLKLAILRIGSSLYCPKMEMFRSWTFVWRINASQKLLLGSTPVSNYFRRVYLLHLSLSFRLLSPPT